jgi:hypothetical protein
MTKKISKVSAATHGYIHLDFEDGSMAVIKPVDYELKPGDSYPAEPSHMEASFSLQPEDVVPSPIEMVQAAVENAQSGYEPVLPVMAEDMLHPGADVEQIVAEDLTEALAEQLDAEIVGESIPEAQSEEL